MRFLLGSKTNFLFGPLKATRWCFTAGLSFNEWCKQEQTKIITDTFLGLDTSLVGVILNEKNAIGFFDVQVSGVYNFKNDLRNNTTGNWNSAKISINQSHFAHRGTADGCSVR